MLEISASLERVSSCRTAPLNVFQILTDPSDDYENGKMEAWRHLYEASHAPFSPNTKEVARKREREGETKEEYQETSSCNVPLKRRGSLACSFPKK